MQIINNTPFPSIGWPSTDAQDTSYVTVLSRVKYLFDTLDADGLWSLKLAPEQEALFAADIFYDETYKEVQFESDFVPYKKCADLIVNLSKSKTEYGTYGVEVLRYVPTPDNTLGIEKRLLKHMSLNHLGFVHRADKERLQWTGTTDKKWIETRAPKYPKDFDEKHYNAAHLDMQLTQTYFEPGDVVMFHKYLPGQHKQAVMIPGVYVKATAHIGLEEQSVLLEADTVVFDIEKLDMKDNSMYVSYRQRIPMSKKVHKVSFDMMLEKALIEQRSA
jgi:hypothetical protein